MNRAPLMLMAACTSFASSVPIGRCDVPPPNVDVANKALIDAAGSKNANREQVGFTKAPRERLPQRVAPSDIPPGYRLVEGDILQRIPGPLQDRATLGNVDHWYDGIVPYAFDYSITLDLINGPARIASAQTAMGMISAVAHVTFIPYTGGTHYIVFHAGGSNNSPVGQQSDAQVINIVSWSSPPTIAHELLHTLGFKHEQSRTDRAQYVVINYAAVCNCCDCNDQGQNCSPCGSQFDIDPNSSHWGSYDFDSLMHYDQYAFSTNPGVAKTILVLPPYTAYQDTIGQRDHLSYFDILSVRGLYPFAGDRWYDQTAPVSVIGTFLSPYSFGLAGAATLTPNGGTLFIKNSGRVSAVGTYTRPMTITAPLGATLGD